MFVMWKVWEVLKQNKFFSEGQNEMKITRSEKTKKSEIKKWDTGKRNKKEV